LEHSLKVMRPGDPGAETPHYDAIVVGSGVAGLRAAIEAGESGLSVALLAKDSASDSSTDRAQGGVAVALSDEDQVGLHYSDTLAAGDGLCDERAVSVMVGEGPRYISQLIEWGAEFDREGSRLAFTREAAHSTRRILHAHGDATGREILRALWHKASTVDGITFFPHTDTIDLTLEDGVCRGLVVLDETTGMVSRFAGDAVVMATGGLGQLYRETTNPPPATGDGVAIAWRAGALLRDMEFVQFHPTSLHIKGAPRFLLSEALRGEGGLLRSLDGRRFMQGVDPRAELAPRDVVAREIYREIVESGADHVLLDLTHLEPGFVEKRFPGIHATCLQYGVDIARAPVPVAPAAHYHMGGIATDLWGRTSIAGLYAAGEVACTGVHGANRLASNSLLEGLVFGARAGRALAEDRPTGGARRRGSGAPAPVPGAGATAQIVADVVDRVRALSWECLGIVRDGAGLAEALRRLEDLEGAIGAPTPSLPAEPGRIRMGLEAANMISLARLVARAAALRRESRGAHFRSDHPRRDDTRFGRSSYIGGGSPLGVIGQPATGMPG